MGAGLLLGPVAVAARLLTTAMEEPQPGGPKALGSLPGVILPTPYIRSSQRKATVLKVKTQV